MVKTRKGLVSLILAVVMVAALLIPMVGPAGASCIYSMTSTSKVVPSTATGTTSNAGTAIYNADAEGNLVVTFDVPTFQSSSKLVFMSLPANPGGYDLYLDGATAQQNLYSELSTVTTLVYAQNALTIANATTWNGNATSFKGTNAGSCATLYANGTSVDPTTSEITLNYSKLNITSFPANLTSVTLDIPVYIVVPTGVTGNIVLTAQAQSSSAFSGGVVNIGTVGAPSVTLAAESSPALSSNGSSIGAIDIKENANGSLATTDDSPALSLTLPAGFTWGSVTPEFMWGDSTVYGVLTTNHSQATTQPPLTGYTTTANNGQELDFYNDGAGSNSGIFMKLNATVNIDPSTAQAGPINVIMGGEITSTVSNITVGNYGSYGATSTAATTVPTIIAGKAASTVGELEIKESAPGSLIIGRSITLTLPSNVMWAEVPSVDPVLSTNLGGLGGLNGYNATTGWSSVGASGNEIQATVSGTATSGNAADIFLKNIEVTPAVDFTPGPVTVTIGGTEGLTGTATLANVASGAAAAASSTPSVGIGQASDTLGDLTITEAAAGNIGATATYSYLNTTTTGSNQEIALTQKTTTQSEIDIYAPAGVTFFATPTVTVASGNIQLGTVSTTTANNNQGELIIPIKNASTSASTIKIAAPQVTIDNTVPNGPVIFKVKGNALDQTELPVTMPTGMTGTQLFPNDTTAGSVTVANLGAATASTSTAGVVIFTIGQASYAANGSPVTIDVAPYIKDSRTFLPLRAVAEALGVSDSNVMWDPAIQKVTILKGNMVVQLTIGSTAMLLNGASITMDAAPEIDSGRTCLPVAWVAKALGANITWDATNQTVTISE